MDDLEETTGADAIVVRTMSEDDLEAVVAIDATETGRRRPSYYAKLLRRALSDTDLLISLVAEAEGRIVGFVVATLFYGEFGVVEPSATIDAIGVDPRWRRQRVGQVLMRQLRLNVGALRIAILRTEVEWDDFDLLAFFQREGFAPSRRLVLECPLDPTAPER